MSTEHNVFKSPSSPIDWEKGLYSCGDENILIMMLEKIEDMTLNPESEVLFNNIMAMDYKKIYQTAHKLWGPFRFLFVLSPTNRLLVILRLRNWWVYWNNWKRPPKVMMIKPLLNFILPLSMLPKSLKLILLLFLINSLIFKISIDMVNSFFLHFSIHFRLNQTLSFSEGPLFETMPFLSNICLVHKRFFFLNNFLAFFRQRWWPLTFLIGGKRKEKDRFFSKNVFLF